MSAIHSSHTSYLTTPQQHLRASTMLVRIPWGAMSVELNLWNPLYAFAPLVLLIFSIPLALFATFTTSIALTLLFLRASIVYVQLTVAIIGAWIIPTPSKPYKLPPNPPLLTSSPKRSSPTSRRHHRSSSVSATSSQETILASTRGPHLHRKSESFTAFMGSNDMTRDFEGVGGWRVAGDDDEEALWMNMNSRLRLPLAPAPATSTRRHRRSLTGDATPPQRWSWSPEAFRMSPVQSRARTPVRFAMDLDEGPDYFPPQSTSTLRPLSTASETTSHHKRRKSGSGSSTATTPGSALVIKEPGE